MPAMLLRSRRLIVGVVTGLSVFAACAQQPSQAQIEALATRTLASMAGDDARLEVAVDTLYGRDLTPEKRKVAKALLRSVFGNERLPRYLAQVLAPVAGPTLTPKEAQAYVIEGMAALQVQGLRRLPTERKARYLQQLLDMAAAVPAGTCKAMFLGKLDARTAGLVAQRHDASLPLGEFEAATQLYRDLVEAELTGYPDVKTLSPAQAKGAERAYELAMNARIRRLPPGLNDRVLRNVEAAEPTEACLWFRETTAAALDLTEPYRGWYLTRFADGLQ